MPMAMSITELATALVRAQAFQDLLERSSESRMSQPARSTKLPDPDKFSGVRTELEDFITQLQLKIRANADHYPTDYAKLGYAITRLKGIALKQITSKLRGDDIQFEDMTEFYTFLRSAFGDPNRAATAREELSNL